MIVAVLFVRDARLGEVSVPGDCRLIHFGGNYFVRLDQEAVLRDGGMGTVFVQSDRHIKVDLDSFEPQPRKQAA